MAQKETLISLLESAGLVSGWEERNVASVPDLSAPGTLEESTRTIADFCVNYNKFLQLFGRGGHVVAEDNLFGPSGIVEIGHGTVGFIQHFIRALAGSERAAVVGVAVYQVGCHAIQYGLSHLGAARVIQEDGRGGETGMASDRWELASNGFRVEGHRFLQVGIKIQAIVLRFSKVYQRFAPSGNRVE